MLRKYSRFAVVDAGDRVFASQLVHRQVSLLYIISFLFYSHAIEYPLVRLSYRAYVLSVYLLLVVVVVFNQSFFLSVCVFLVCLLVCLRPCLFSFSFFLFFFLFYARNRNHSSVLGCFKLKSLFTQ